MKIVTPVLALLFGFILSLTNSLSARAGFELFVDESTLRQVNGIWELDVKIQSVGPSTTIYSLLLNLRLLPGDGQPLDTLNGISFVGLANPQTGALFNSIKEINADPSSAHFMPGSLINAVEVSAPAAATNAFTVRFVSYRPNPTDVKVAFMDAGNFYQIDDSADGLELKTFANLTSSGNLSITGVPEPGSWTLGGGILAATWLRRRTAVRRAARRGAGKKARL